MAQRIKVKTKNGAISYFDPRKWEKVQKNPLFQGVFTVITPNVPPEVKKLEEEKAKKAEQAQPKKGTSTDKTEEVK